MEQNVEYWDLFIKQKAGTINSLEQKKLDDWKKADASHVGLIQQFESIFQQTSTDQETPLFEPTKRWGDLQTLIKINEGSRKAGNIRLFPRIARIAAAIILIVGVSFIVYYTADTGDSLNLQTMVRSGEMSKKTVELPDGTVVTLNRETELLYPEKFAADQRIVYLEGEAFFDVSHDKKRPFIIHSGITKTIVLGTSFNLRAYSKEDEVKLTVVTGKVAFTLADDKEGVIVTPGNMALFTSNNKTITHGSNQDINFLSWKTGHLIFNDSPMDSLLISLENHYGISLKVEHAQTQLCRFTGDFQDTSLESALKIITRATGTSYLADGDSYIITGKGCN